MGDTITIKVKSLSQVSDGYHTIEELYKHRNYLFLALLNAVDFPRWKSKKHNDGTEFDDWFIAGIDLPTDTITYHLPIYLWGLCNASTLQKAPKWDGHTSEDVICRLEKLLCAE